MTRTVIFKNTVTALSKLPKEKLTEVADFVDFLSKKDEDKAIENIALNSKALSFLEDEEDLYSIADLKKKFH